jgi:hypothetical protein
MEICKDEKIAVLQQVSRIGMMKGDAITIRYEDTKIRRCEDAKMRS